MTAFGKKKINKVQTVLTIDTSAITAGEVMHTGIIEISNCLQYGKSGKIVGVTVTDEDAKTSALAIHFFSENPSLSTITANSVPTIHDDDLLKYIGHISVPTANYESFINNSEATVQTNLPVVGNDTNRSLYILVVTKTTATWTTATAITINLFIEQD